MAEFREVMQQYIRMFEAHKQGVSIPVEASYETAVKQPEYFEEVVMSWAAEHPERIYPTWGEWLMKQGVISGLAPGRAFDGNGGLKQRIPEYIAEKLEIDPKEG